MLLSDGEHVQDWTHILRASIIAFAVSFWNVCQRSGEAFVCDNASSAQWKCMGVPCRTACSTAWWCLTVSNSGKVGTGIQRRKSVNRVPAADMHHSGCAMRVNNTQIVAHSSINNRHIVCHVLTFVTAFVRDYNLNTPWRKMLLYKHEVEIKTRSHFYKQDSI
jgi:hypothetical protein